jgi:tetratricopeptide (TPR) repeat protein
MVWRNSGRTLFLAWLLALGGPALAGPTTPALIAELGAALEKGDAAQALQLADGGLKAGDLSALERGRLLLDRGLAHELLGDHDEALQDFTAAIETHALPPSERGQALLQRGFLLDGLGRLDDAAKDYSAVIALKSEAVGTALNNRANIYRRQNKLADARRDYLAALADGRAKPQYPYYGLGQIAEAQKDTNAARGFYAKSVAADPGYVLAADRLAALGGAPDGALAEPDHITLHPPSGKPAPAAAAPAETAPVVEKPVTLHAPKPRAAASHKAPAGAVSPGLRPALDGPTAGSEPEVQLGAWRSEPEAQAGWQKAQSKAGGALYGLAAHVVMADLSGKGRYFRLRVATPDPAGLCGRLRQQGLDCARVRN